MTINSLTSVSLEPPLVLACLARGARTTEAVVESGRFAISILGLHQEATARRFATPGEQHYGDLPLTFGRLGVPVVPNALAFLECVVERTLLAGDHLIVLGDVHEAKERDGGPLVFVGGKFGEVIAQDADPLPWFF